MKGGDTIHIKIKETIYHPGFYRVALAVKDRAELPKDPDAITRQGTRGPISVSGRIESNPQLPVLADGLFLHHAAPAKDTFWEADVKLPNINCDKCTLQIIQLMTEQSKAPYDPSAEDADDIYYQCIDLRLQARR